MDVAYELMLANEDFTRPHNIDDARRERFGLIGVLVQEARIKLLGEEYRPRPDPLFWRLAASHPDFHVFASCYTAHVFFV